MHQTLRWLCSLACVGFFPLQAAAPNDNFADAIDITSQPLTYYAYVGGTGTAEPGEPAHAGSPAAQSFWFQWQAPADQVMAFGEYLNGSNSRIGIYIGTTVDMLTPVAQGTSRVFFAAKAGVRYRIAIDSPGSDSIYLRQYPAGGADLMADATIVGGPLPCEVRGNNIFATASPGDPDLGTEHPANHSVWWSWTAPATGALRVDNRLSDFGPMLFILERPPGGTATKICSGLDAAGFAVTAGNEYLICVDAFVGDPGEISLWFDWVPTGPPPNDDMENATDLGNARITCDGAWMLFATPQAGAPNEDPGYPEWNVPGDRTVWWKWTCPENGYYRIATYGSNIGAEPTVYTGMPGALSYLSSATVSDGFRISVTAGTTYWIQVRDWRKITPRTELCIYPALNEPPYFRKLQDRGMVRIFGRDRHPTADPDGDAFPNQIELACGSNPQKWDMDNINLPHLISDGSGIWKLRWREDGYYLQSSAPLPIALTAKVAASPAGPWSTTTVNVDPGTNAKVVQLPSGVRGFARLELNDPNWSLTP